MTYTAKPNRWFVYSTLQLYKCCNLEDVSENYWVIGRGGQAFCIQIAETQYKENHLLSQQNAHKCEYPSDPKVGWVKSTWVRRFSAFNTELSVSSVRCLRHFLYKYNLRVLCS